MWGDETYRGHPQPAGFFQHRDTVHYKYRGHGYQRPPFTPKKSLRCKAHKVVNYEFVCAYWLICCYDV